MDETFLRMSFKRDRKKGNPNFELHRERAVNHATAGESEQLSLLDQLVGTHEKCHDL